MIPAVFIVLAACAPGCGSGSCNQDTDCKFPQICVLGTCADKYPPPDAAPDTPYDFGDWQETPPDPVESDIEIIHDSTDESPGEAEMEVVEEDVEEEELPPATVLWSEDFSEDPIQWQYQQGNWQVVGGEYQQSTDMMSESWVPAESWTDYAAEVSIVADSIDTTAPRAVVGMLFRVDSIDPSNYYLCGMDFNQNVVILLRYDAIAPGYHSLCISPAIDPAPQWGPTAPWYKIQVVALGSRLTCRLASESGDPAIAEVSASDEAYTSGSIGVFTNKASGRFDDVIVYDHRPPEWPRAANRLACP
jgi:hypothetical protein